MQLDCLLRKGCSEQEGCSAVVSLGICCGVRGHKQGKTMAFFEILLMRWSGIQKGIIRGPGGDFPIERFSVPVANTYVALRKPKRDYKGPPRGFPIERFSVPVANTYVALRNPKRDYKGSRRGFSYRTVLGASG